MSKPTGGKVAFGGVSAAAILALAWLLGDGFEDRKLTSYWDAIGSVWTVCGGVTGPTIGPNQTYTEAECVAMEAAYLQRMYARMGQCVQGEFDPAVVKAFGHFAYNVGEDTFCRSTAARLLNEGRVRAACEQIPRWRFAGGKDCAIRANRCYGIVNRREWEFKTCMEGVP